MEESARGRWTPTWIAVACALGAVATVLAARAHILPLTAAALLILSWIGAAGSVIAWFAQDGAIVTLVYRVLVWLTGGEWVCQAVRHGLSQRALLVLVAGTVAFGALAPICHPVKTPPPPRDEQPIADDPDPGDTRPEVVKRWEALLRHILKRPVRVTQVVPWDNPQDGTRVHLELAMGMTLKDIADACDQIAGATRLPIGCNVRALEGDHQGAAALDVMTRDCLADEVLVGEDFTPASVNDEFTVMTSPRGERLDVCLREQSMVVGGAPGSGKTTLLHRIILHLARCVDALVWVIDLNGGGVAEPFIAPWARGEAKRPLIDWVADNEAEAALLVATAIAVAKGRKTSREATRRKREANITVLPVDAKLPAIIVITDEGGEVQQAVSLLGQAVATGASRIAQIGRAEGVRAIMSVLRGTADLLSKGLRVNAALRICLKMMEETEYDHVLGANPGRTKLRHKGAGYIMRGFVDVRPVFGRTVNVLLDQIDRATIGCADLRPDLDPDGLRDAARVRASDVLGGRRPDPEYLELAPLRDAEDGRGYTGRWDRYGRKLAEMRGEDLPEEEPPAPKPAPARAAAPIVPPGTPLGNLLDAFGATQAGDRVPAPVGGGQAHGGGMSDEKVRAAFDEIAAGFEVTAEEPSYDQASVAAPAGKAVARDNVLALLADAGRPLTAKEIRVELDARQQGINRTYLQTGVLKPLLDAGVIAQTDGGAYYLVGR